MTEALFDASDLLVVGVPTFGWAEGRYFLVKFGSGAEIAHYLDARPEDSEDVMLVLRYFDAMNFAGMIRCGTLIGLGLRDPVVPAETVYSIANHLSAPCEIMEFPVSHTELAAEKRWEEFEARWLALGRGEAQLHPTITPRQADPPAVSAGRMVPEEPGPDALRTEKSLEPPARLGVGGSLPYSESAGGTPAIAREDACAPLKLARSIHRPLAQGPLQPSHSGVFSHVACQTLVARKISITAFVEAANAGARPAAATAALIVSM